MLPTEGEEAALLSSARPSVRTLQLQKRQRLSVAEQDHHISGGLRLQRHLQFHYTSEGAFPLQNIPESHNITAGAETGHRIS